MTKDEATRRLVDAARQAIARARRTPEEGRPVLWAEEAIALEQAVLDYDVADAFETAERAS